MHSNKALLTMATALLLSGSMLLSSTSCKKEEKNEDSKTPVIITDEPGKVTAKIDGVPFSSKGFFAVNSQLKINSDNSYRINIGAEAEVNGIEDLITFSLFGTDFNVLKAGDVFVAGANLNNDENVFDGDFYRRSRIPGNNLDIISDSEQNANSTGTITAIDRVNRLITGTFEFKAIDIFGSGESYLITDGTFFELSY